MKEKTSTEEEKIKVLNQESKKIKLLLKKYQIGKKKKLRLIPFDQPIVFLIRRGRKVEFNEAKKDKSKFKYIHSNGEERDVDLKDGHIYEFDYGENKFKGYIHHEDWGIPLIPEEPLVEFKQQKNMVHNAMSAELKWKAEEKKAYAAQLKALAGLAAVVVGGFILFRLLVPSTPAPAEQQAVTTMIENTSTIIKMIPVG